VSTSNYTGSPNVGNIIGHVYVSTACQHGIHEHCKSGTNLDGAEKIPASCKWCAAPCVCTCHGATPGQLAQHIEAIIDQALAQHETGHRVNVWAEISELAWRITRQST
jgi:hypothetical protein